MKFQTLKPARALASLALLLALAACNVPSGPAAPSVTAPTLAAPTAAPTEAPTQAPTAAPTAAATSQPTLEPTQPAPLETIPPAPGGPIRRGALRSLAEDTIPVPEYPERLLWPAPEAPLPGGPSPRPELLLQAGPNLHPVLLEPIGLGQPMPLPLNGTQPLAFSPDGLSMVVKDPSRTALFRLDGPIVRELPQPANALGASYSREGQYLVVYGEDMEAWLYDLFAGRTAEPVRLFGFQTAAPVYSVSVAPGGKTIAWVSRATLQFQDVASGVMGPRLEHTDFITTTAFSPDGSTLALEAAGTLYLYAVPSGAELAKMPLAAPFSSIDFSPDGALIAAGDATGLSIFDAATLEPLLSLPGQGGSTALVSFSPDGTAIAAMHEGNVLGVWKVR